MKNATITVTMDDVVKTKEIEVADETTMEDVTVALAIGTTIEPMEGDGGIIKCWRPAFDE
jgi:hypothetical protein